MIYKRSTKKDFIKFLSDKRPKINKDDKWLFGNLDQLPAKALERNNNFAIKYWVFKKNKTPKHDLKVQRNATEYTFIIKGKIEGVIEGKKIILKTGDYVIIPPGTVNNLIKKVVENTVRITIKSPSLDRTDTVKIKNSFI